jgi:hypothetical protein
MQLQDFVAELQNRGFDGFSPEDLKQLINRGYFWIARRAPWYFNQADYSGAVPSNGQLSVVDVGTLMGFRSVDAVYWRQNSTNYIRLKALSQKEFDDLWRPDYENGFRANPSRYFIDGNTLWALPVMDNPSGSIEIHYNKRPVALVNDTDVAATPVDYDELILKAALIRCHGRANETNLALVLRQELEEDFDSMEDLESTRMNDQQDRVLPDNTWA